MADADLDFTVARLGECRIPSPMQGVRFTADDEHVLYHARLEDLKPWLDRGEDLRPSAPMGQKTPAAV